MERTVLIRVATELGLDFKKNAKTTSIQELVDRKVAELNGISPDFVIIDETTTFCGTHPMTGEKVYK